MCNKIKKCTYTLTNQFTKEEVCLLERSISYEDRIKRAEEIYNRRRMAQEGVRVQTVNVNKSEKIKYSLYKRMILQIVICFFIYLIFYLIKNSNYIFSEDVINKTKEFLSYDINFQSTYNYVVEYYNNNIKPVLESNIKNQNTNLVDVNELVNEVVVNEVTDDTLQNDLNGIGGGTDENIIGEINSEQTVQTSADEQQEVEELSQMEIDANDIKANYSFIVPLRGTISSRYGPRTATEIVSANHAGIDIAVNEGTVFVAAMEGTITKVSSYGSYGNHVYIENGDVLTIYAHCKTIYVKEGNTIKQGEQIGEVGQTGNATGPHLHFEIRKSGRVVNPEYVLSFT